MEQFIHELPSKGMVDECLLRRADVRWRADIINTNSAHITAMRFSHSNCIWRHELRNARNI